MNLKQLRTEKWLYMKYSAVSSDIDQRSFN